MNDDYARQKNRLYSSSHLTNMVTADRRANGLYDLRKRLVMSLWYDRKHGYRSETTKNLRGIIRRAKQRLEVLAEM